MKIRICTLLLILMLSGAAGHEPVLAADEDMQPPSEGISLDFRDVELTELVRTVSEMTGKNFIFDDSVKGKATIISPRPLSSGEAYEAFLAVLNVKGYTVVPSGKMHKIVPLRDAKMTNLPTGDGRDSEHYVTRLIRLKNIDAETVANSVLNSLVPKTSQIAVYSPTNTLIITDNAANIERLRKIVAQLDVESGIETIEVLQLENSTAEGVAAVCNEVFSQQSVSSRARRRTSAATVSAEAAKIIPFERTNALVLAGTPEDLTSIRLLIDKLDREPSRHRAGINVFYLNNADAEGMAETLNEILTGIKKQPAASPQDRLKADPSVSEVTITADKPTNSLIVNATSEDYETISQIIRQLDMPRKQVFVEALILELSLDAVKQLGVSLQGGVTVDDDSLTFGTSNLNSGQVGLGDLAPGSDSENALPSLLTQTVNGILLGGLFNPITVDGPDGNPITVPAFSALIDLAKTDTDVNILSAPRLLTLDNEEAEIVVGSNVPIISERLSDTTNPNAQTVSIERQDVALTLRLTPQITEGALVRLEVMQEITELAPTASSVGNVNEVGPTLTKRLLTNTVVVEDGRTAVLGGLISSNKQTQVSKVPFLGDIPLLGWLFRSKRDSESKTSLMVFVTPRIIRSPEDLAAVTHRNRRATERFRSGQTQQEVLEENYRPEGMKVSVPEAGGPEAEGMEDGI